MKAFPMAFFAKLLHERSTHRVENLLFELKGETTFGDLSAFRRDQRCHVFCAGGGGWRVDDLRPRVGDFLARFSGHAPTVCNHISVTLTWNS